MIPYNAINAWGVAHPWITREQIEQDLLLSRAIYDIYSNSFLSGELTIENLEKKLLDDKFVTDIDNLVSTNRIDYSVEEAASFIVERYLQHL